MQFLIWMVGILILCLWSATVWIAQAAVSLALTLPWNEVMAALKSMPLPEMLRPFLEPWLGGAWSAWIEAFAPLMQWLGTFVQGSAGWLASALPVIAWLVWGLGSLVLIAILSAASAALWFSRRKMRLQRSMV